MIQQWVRDSAGYLPGGTACTEAAGVGHDCRKATDALLRALSLQRVPAASVSQRSRRRRASLRPANTRQPQIPIPRGRVGGGLSMDRLQRASSGAAGANVRGGVGRCPSSRADRLRCCHLPCTRSCPVSRPRTLTDAQNALYSCLPNHALRWLKVSEAAPASKRIRVIY